MCVGGGGGLGTTYDVHLRLIGKRVVDFFISVNWSFFHLLRLSRYERRDRKSAI